MKRKSVLGIVAVGVFAVGISLPVVSSAGACKDVER